MAISGPKCCFRHITILDPQLMISVSQINLEKKLCTLKLVKKIIYPRKRILVLNCHLVQLFVINAQSKCTILFLHKEKYWVL